MHNTLLANSYTLLVIILKSIYNVKLLCKPIQPCFSQPLIEAVLLPGLHFSPKWKDLNTFLTFPIIIITLVSQKRMLILIILYQFRFTSSPRKTLYSRVYFLMHLFPFFVVLFSFSLWGYIFKTWGKSFFLSEYHLIKTVKLYSNWYNSF